MQMPPSSSSNTAQCGYWLPENGKTFFNRHDLVQAAHTIRHTVYVIFDSAKNSIGAAFGGRLSAAKQDSSYVCLGVLPPLYPEWLGDRLFTETHGVRFPYVIGEMARGIASEALVIAAAKTGVLGFFGAAGFPVARVAKAIDQINAALPQGTPWGCNIIHNPDDPAGEMQLVELLLQRNITIASAAAFMNLTPAIVRYAITGLRHTSAGIARKNALFAKVSRPEVARLFMSPAPDNILRVLLEKQFITPEEADLAKKVPVAEDITVEADSGGHTDNRPLVAIFPAILEERNRLQSAFGYARPIRLGAAGGIGTPEAAAAAYALGASYVLTGSINEASLEAGISAKAKAMLAAADVADVAMCPAADMFELGIKVQVLKRGTLFAQRASLLYDIYRQYRDLAEIPADVRQRLEQQIFRKPLDAVWEETRQFFLTRKPEEADKAEKNPKYKMALIFRWYLGNGSRWAVEGTPDRVQDYQIWCGPAMGAFNSWAKGSFLEDPNARSAEQITKNMLEGAAVLTRAHQLRNYGIPLPSEAFDFKPRVL
jgi:PfaD family protein